MGRSEHSEFSESQPGRCETGLEVGLGRCGLYDECTRDYFFFRALLLDKKLNLVIESQSIAVAKALSLDSVSR
jgi:hypothetical protein